MSSYIEKNLLPGEQVVYRGHRHWVVFTSPIVWVIMAFLAYWLMPVSMKMWAALIALAIAVMHVGWAFIDYNMSEITVTSERILIKIGWISRSSLETDVTRISSIDVIQTFWGRILNFGTVIICDVGNMRTPFDRIARPFDFRRAVLLEIEKRRKNVGQDTSGKSL
jgi:uncharacterized membrane protein YdbT with pleckstrin-like domain